MIKQICIASLIIFITASANAQAPDSLSLQQCIETGLKNNLDVKQNELQMKTDNIYLRQARSNLLPVISGTALHGINQGRSIDPYTNNYINQQVNFAEYGANGNLVLFNGFGYQNAIRQNNLAYQAGKLDWQQSKDNLTLNIIVAYLNVLTASDLMQSERLQTEVAARQVERLAQLNEQGAIVPSQLYDLKGQLADDKITFINAESTLNAAKISLAGLMNVPYNQNLRLLPLSADQFSPAYSSSPDQIYADAVQHLAIVKAAQLRKQSAEKGVDVARSNYYPLLSLNANLNTNYSNAALRDVIQSTFEIPSSDYIVVDGNKFPVFTQQNNFLSQKINYSDQVRNNVSTSLSLGLSIPIFNYSHAKQQVALAKINLENATAVESATEIRLKQDIDNAYFNMTSVYNRYQTLNEQVDAYNESFREAEVRFNSGAITSVDYLIAKNNLDRANNNFIVAKYDYVLRTRILDYYQGKALW